MKLLTEHDIEQLARARGDAMKAPAVRRVGSRRFFGLLPARPDVIDGDYVDVTEQK